VHRRRTATSSLTALAAAAVLVASCSSSSDTSATSTTERATTTSTEPSEPLTILVTNDDGIGAPGIDALVTALSALDAVEVVVVAPAANQSGSGDTTTAGPVAHSAGATASGVAGTAVQGLPADTIAVALDELGVEPDVVVSGVNEGQNVGIVAPISGTLGAARTALRRGIPAVASSAGIGELADFATGARLVVDWITEHRAELLAGTAPHDTVTSFNVPGCQTGTTKELIEVPLATALPAGVNPFVTADCSLPDAQPPADDVAGLVAGHLVVTAVPAEL
jgi:5'-nucleotidase